MNLGRDIYNSDSGRFSLIEKICLKILLHIPMVVLKRYFRVIGNILNVDKAVPVQRLYHDLGKLLPLTFTQQGIEFDATYAGAMARGRNLLVNEPDTINWLDDYLLQGDVFLDIGANIGVYSLYAAKKSNTVVSIEPDPPPLTGPV